MSLSALNRAPIRGRDRRVERAGRSLLEAAAVQELWRRCRNHLKAIPIVAQNSLLRP